MQPSTDSIVSLDSQANEIAQKAFTFTDASRKREQDVAQQRAEAVSHQEYELRESLESRAAEEAEHRERHGKAVAKRAAEKAQASFGALLH